MSELQEKEPINTFFYFPSAVYSMEKPDFLEISNLVTNESLAKMKKNKLNKIFPVYMTDNFVNDKRIEPLAQYIAQTAWNILHSQGYNMDMFHTTVMELWAQEHHTRSSNEEHVHGYGSQLTGFYILEAPEKGSTIAIHDPRPAKRLINLPQAQPEIISQGSLSIYFTPKVGELYFINSYVPHEITRNMGSKPFKFIHFTVGVVHKQQIGQSTNPEAQQAEII